MSSSSSLSACEPFNLDVHGRQGVGVAQPQSGVDYPLIRPSEDVRYLIADAHLSFDQPSDYNALIADFVLPFRVHWLYGFGCIPPNFPVPTLQTAGSSSSWSSVCNSTDSSLSSNSSLTVVDCLPTPKHAHDIIVVDANGHKVFDSTEPLITYEHRTWGDRLSVVMWRHPTDATMSLVYHTAWGPNDDPEPRNYPVYFFPTQAILDERTIERLPKRLRSLTVVLDNLRKTPVEFSAGYNMSIITGDTIEDDGSRRTTRVTFNATPGNGFGTFPGCEPEDLVVRSINGVGPTDYGDFFLSATDCYWVRQPTRVISDDPRETLPEILLPPGNVPAENLPDVDAGTAKNLPGWPTDDDQRYAHLQIGNDCGPCCDCPDYVVTAEYMNRIRDDYHDIGILFEDIRDTYHTNRERWLTTACCFERQPLRVRLLPQVCPYLDVAIQYCNQENTCKQQVELTITFTTSPDGATAVEVPGYTFITGATAKPGRTSPRTERYQMSGNWPIFKAYWDVVQPRQSVNARFRLLFDNCGIGTTSSSSANPSIATPIVVTGCVNGTVEGSPILIPNCGSEPLTYDEAYICETQALACPPTQPTAYNPLICACEE